MIHRVYLPALTGAVAGTPAAPGADPQWLLAIALVVGIPAAITLYRCRAAPWPDTLARTVLVATWVVLSVAIGSVLLAWGDAWGVVLTLAALPLAVVEGIALASAAGGDTYSERLTWWGRSHRWGRAVLVAVMVALGVHLWVGWP